ncbi:RND family transporter [Caballeronia sp. S22]|jgi:predicted RND superfamily exporter protein|uniref:efflux RND transporter permease subunit n=1 Tax=Caballeronia sp. S22 TaxID=3137182 RepID=UPI003530DC94
MLNRLIGHLENQLFRHRFVVLLALALLTATMGWFAIQLRMDAGFEKQIPVGHEYVKTFQQYRNELFGANRLTVVVKARHGTIWTKAALTRLYKVTQAVILLPNVDRLGVQSLWTPNSFVNEITEEGFRSQPIISGTLTDDTLTPDDVANIRRSTSDGGFIGSLVSRDQTAAMITAEINETGADGKKIDYVAYNHMLEKLLRQPYEDGDYEIQIIGFAKQIGDIADGASSVLVFCGVALLLTALAVYWYCHSVRFTILPVMCSLTSLVWQFGALRLLGYGLDPLGVLVPFLVFAIGVSHGVQQINYMTRELGHGKSSMEAARLSFSGLFVPGTLALLTALVSFVTLLRIPIPMIRELAITASLGVGFKIVTNLVMLPLVASYFTFSRDYAAKVMKKREQRVGWLRTLARVAEPRNAVIVLVAVGALFATAVWESRDRVVGTLQPGAPELRPESRFNRDAVAIASGFDVGLDWLSVAVEAPADSCDNPAVGTFDDQLADSLRRVPGVVSVASYPAMLRQYNEGYNEGNPRMSVVPIDPVNYAGLSAEIGRVRGYLNKDCSMTAIHAYLSDHKATTINAVIAAVVKYRDSHPTPGIKVRLAAGNAGLLAAIDDEVEKSELPMMLYVYAAIVLLVFFAYRDLRAVIACCLPLTVGTFIGYWFMKKFEIGLTVATLPVMVLAVGIGVDYAFYIYNRLQAHLGAGEEIVRALEHSILEVGMATIFTAITLAIGVATWSFSALKFQADMGKLLAFMFIVNLVMAMTALPALAVVLDRLCPRRKPVRPPSVFSH